MRRTERIARLLGFLETTGLEVSAESVVEDANLVTGWFVQRGTSRSDAATFYVSTPTQPRAAVRHAVPPSEHHLAIADLLLMLRMRWAPEARAVLAGHHHAGGRAAGSGGSDPSPAISASDIDERRWGVDPAGVWHRVGTVGAVTNGHTLDAPPTGVVVCESCLMRGLAAVHGSPRQTNNDKT